MNKRTPKEILELLESKLPALEKLVKMQFRVDVTFTVKMKEYKNTPTFEISSRDFSGRSPMLELMFKEIQFYFWGGEYHEDKEDIYFNPKVFWKSHSNGSNGTDVLWDRIFFDLTTDSWITSEPLLA
jgi:hypothetical protein